MQIKSENIFTMNVFGNNLRRIRKQKELTMKQLAEAVGVKHQSVEKWETGKTMPKGKTLEALLEFLNISANELMYEQSPANSSGIVEAGDKIIVDKELWFAKERELQLYRENAELQRKVESLKNAATVSE